MRRVVVFWALLAAPVINEAALPGSNEESNGAPRCLLIFDRHNHKTGGTTMRDIFTHQQAAGRCFYWGYGPAQPYWSRLMSLLENGGQPFASAPGKLLRLCTELHFRVPYWAEDVRKQLRPHATGSCRAPSRARGAHCSTCTLTVCMPARARSRIRACNARRCLGWLLSASAHAQPARVE